MRLPALQVFYFSTQTTHFSHMSHPILPIFQNLIRFYLVAGAYAGPARMAMLCAGFPASVPLYAPSLPPPYPHPTPTLGGAEHGEQPSGACRRGATSARCRACAWSAVLLGSRRRASRSGDGVACTARGADDASVGRFKTRVEQDRAVSEVSREFSDLLGVVSELSLSSAAAVRTASLPARRVGTFAPRTLPPYSHPPPPRLPPPPTPS